nr:probable protein phosphatase 2C 12 [Tanacetum cinerariifolium]
MSCVNKNEHVPLSVLLKRELVNEKADRPEIVCAQANQSKKGEDFALIKTGCERALGDALTTYSVFGIFDGHNGSAAAIYTKENLLNNVLCALPPDLNRDEWVAALPRALVAAFVKTDKDFQEKAQMSGTTVTFVIIEGLIVTVASVGDSRCILESADGSIYHLSADHRLDTNEEERERVTACGGEVGRLNTGAGTEMCGCAFSGAWKGFNIERTEFGYSRNDNTINSSSVGTAEKLVTSLNYKEMH